MKVQRLASEDHREMAVVVEAEISLGVGKSANG